MFDSNLQELFWKFFRFGVVGAGGTLIDFGITYVSKEAFKAHKYVANGLGFAFGATFNYTLNRYWTFHSNNPHVGKEYFEFLIVSLIGLSLNTAVLYYLHHNRKLNFYLAKVLATGIVLFWNFFANNMITFRH